MNEHQLRCFVAAARYLNFTKAAQDLFMTQAAVSYQIGELEKSLDVRLFLRAQGEVSLTPAGMSFLESAQTLLRDMERAKEGARQASSDERKILRIGTFGDVLHPLLPAALARFRSCHEGVRVELMQGLAHELVGCLNSGDLDVAFVTGYGDFVSNVSWIDSTLLFRDSHVALVPRSHPLAGRTSVTFQELEGVSKVLLGERDLLERENSMTHGASHALLLRDPDSVRIMVEAGYGVCVCVSHVVASLCCDVAVVPIESSSMDIFACRRKTDNRSLTAAFIQTIAEVCREQIA